MKNPDDVLIKTHNPLRSYNRLSFWRSHYPKIPGDQTKENTWNVFDLCPLDSVKVVVLGDKTPSCIAFSALPHQRVIPRTTQNVLREYVSDLGFPPPRSGDLRAWCKRGVLLLPVRLGHDQKWDMLTYEICRVLSRRPNMVFHLWGQDARAFGGACEGHVFKTSHPSPRTCHKGFLGSRPFTWTNSVLVNAGLPHIDWRLD